MNRSPYRYTTDASGNFLSYNSLITRTGYTRNGSAHHLMFVPTWNNGNTADLGNGNKDNCLFNRPTSASSSYIASKKTGENIFIVKDKVLRTPPLTTMLGGITRLSIIKLARDLGYTVEEQDFSRDELYIADEAFFTGTAAEMTPIREVDRRVIGEGHAGPVTKHLQQEFFKVVHGENPAYADWLATYTV
jgi:hypothetical protein